MGLIVIAWNMMRGMQGSIDKYAKIYQKEMEKEEGASLLQEGQND